jgi:hypothetical protein
MKLLLIFVICCLPVFAGLAQSSKGTGVIYGTVVSQSGVPGKRMTLYAELLNVGGQFPKSKSNDRGEYRFENLPWGRYTVFAEDRDIGYSGDVIDSSSQPSVEISREHPEAEFRIVLPSKAGFLQIELTNRRTGTTIPRMGLSLARSEAPEHSFLSSNSNSSEVILVPPDRNLLVHVIADGFREWDESVGGGKPIFVASGTRLSLDVQLEPIQ